MRNIDGMRWLLCAALFFGMLPLYAQSGSVISGRVIDGKTKESLPYATIRFRQHGETISGVVTNLDGDFSIPTAYQSRIDSLLISSVGYVSKRISINALSATEITVITLLPGAVTLKDVTVKAVNKLSARKIFNSAIEQLPVNYPMKPFTYVGYYREYQLDKQDYVNLDEAIVEVDDVGFGTNDFDSTKVRIVQYRENNTFKRDKTTAAAYDSKTMTKFIPSVTVQPLGGNELSQLRIHDAIRNNQEVTFSLVNKLVKDFAENHALHLMGTVTDNSLRLYQIHFTSLRSPGFRGEGDIFIERGNFAIHKLTYTMSTTTEPVRQLYEVICEYQRVGERMYPNYISFNNTFQVVIGAPFRITEAYFDKSIGAFVVFFNQSIDRALATDKENYTLSFGDEKIPLDRAVNLLTQPNRVTLFLSPATLEKLMRLDEDFFSKISIKATKIKDILGREIGQSEVKTLQQFREFFSQKINTTPVFPSLPVMSKQKSISSQRPEGSGIDTKDYWMNSPLKK